VPMRADSLRWLLILVLACCFWQGCRRSVPVPPPPPPPLVPAETVDAPPQPLAIRSFTVEPAQVERGQPITLRWEVTGAKSVEISQGLGEVPPVGSKTLVPPSSATLVMTARGPAGEQQTARVKVVVEGSEMAAPIGSGGLPPPRPQRESGEIAGILRDPAGAEIPGAQLQLTDEHGRTRQTISAADGRFRFPDLPEGTYRLEVSLPGFKVWTRDGIPVPMLAARPLEIVMPVGDLAESVGISDPGGGSPPPLPSPLPPRTLATRVVVPPGAAVDRRPASGSASAGANPFDDALRRLRRAGYAFDAPAFPAGGQGTARLVIDPQPYIARSQEEFQTRLTEPGNIAGGITRIGPRMQADLSSEGDGLQIVGGDEARQRVSFERPTQWIWRLAGVREGPQGVTLELRAEIEVEGQKEFARVEPFPITLSVQVGPPVSGSPGGPVVSGTTPAPGPGQPVPGPSSPLGMWQTWVAAGLLAVMIAILVLRGAAVAAWLSANMKRRVPALAALLPFSRTSAETLVRILVIHDHENRADVEEFCRHMDANDPWDFITGSVGFVTGSELWQREFLGNLAQADAVMLLLTSSTLGKEWITWQIEQATEAHEKRHIPLLAAALDENVARSAQALGRLGLLPWLSASTPQGRRELREVLAKLAPCAARDLLCFLSYSRRDGEFAATLRSSLQRHGIACWVDVEGIPGGAEWERKIARAIESSTHVLFVLSKHSADSMHVANEIAWAREKGKVIIPLLIEEVSMPYGVHRTQAILFFAQGFDVALQRLVRDLTSAPGKAGAAGR
jgi:hypothetical protein